MTTNRAVVCVRDPDLLDTVLRVAAAASCTVDRAPDAVAARRDAHGARLVVLDPSAAAEWHAARLPAHHGVVLVCPQDHPGTVYKSAVDLGAARVIRLPVGEGDLVEEFADAAEGRSRSPGVVIAVVGGRGGAGASVFAAALGLAALHRGHNVFLVDCDPHGSGVDLVLGADSLDGARWSDLRIEAGRVSAAALRRALPTMGRGKAELTVLACRSHERGPTTAAAVTAVVEAGLRAGYTVVCDLPRTIGERESAVLARSAMAVLVVPVDVRSCSAARGLAAKLRDRTDNVQLVARGLSPTGLTGGDLAKVLEVPLLTEMRDQPALARSLDIGEFDLPPRSPLALATAVVLDAVAAATTSVKTAA
ncbi:septum site-determining protein Ssd [Labedaea rhizosphaerae]|uniref:Secretion/DNA translocation related CpaE-like protein n=1 Tax=Labedaea rhizosphaerae TaxID=598644 RepID=A0A4R6SLB9_LABRH|nr:septum site-determining protein Ssd [Labedaea rhizosphaerae]TDQ04747.1 secretion/DNA translocation related CpaE-like protein [Labedaea rhizosphaerae]